MGKCKLITKAQFEKLLANGQKHLDCENRTGNSEYFCEVFEPVVKLFNPAGSQTWLLTEIDPENPDTAFGLCDLGLGFPELGVVSISELESLRFAGGLKVERDRFFKAQGDINFYHDEAERLGHIQA